MMAEKIHSRSSKNKFQIMIALWLSTVALPSALNAQATQVASAPDTGQSNAQVQEIVVTAQKRQESSQKVPIAISAFSAQQLQRLNLATTAGLQFATPGLVAQAAGGNSLIFLRGVGSPIASPGADSSVATYVDGYYIASPQGNVQELFDAERVEILKGPQASLYGRNANGGAINFVSRRPDTGKFSGRASGMYGTLNEREFDSYLTGPLSDTLAFSLAGHYNKRDTYLRIAAPAPAGIDPTEMNDSVRAKILWHFSSNYDALLTGSYSRNRSIEAAAFMLLPGSASEAAAIGAPVSNAKADVYLSGEAPRQDVRQHMLLLTQELHLAGDLTVRSLTGYNATKQVNANFPASASRLNILSFGAHLGQSKQFSQEIQILSSGGMRFSWIVGGSYFHAKDAYTDEFTKLPLASAVLGLFSNQAVYDKQLTNAYAGNGEGTFHVTDRLSLIAGGRYTSERKKLPRSNYTIYSGIPIPSPLYDCAFAGLTSGVNCGGAGLGLPAIPAAFVGAGAAALNGVRQPYAAAGKTWGRVSYRATAHYELTPRLSFYYTNSRGFKSGAYNLSALSTKSNVPVDPEILVSNEIGIKSEWFDRRLRFNAAAFYYHITHTQAQVLVGGTSGSAVLADAGSATLKGGEADLDVVPVRNLTLSMSGAYVHSRYNDFVSYPASVPATPGGGTTGAGGNKTVATNVVGNPLVFAPKLTSSVSANYTFRPAGGGAIALPTLWAYNDGYCLEQACHG